MPKRGRVGAAAAAKQVDIYVGQMAHVKKKSFLREFYRH